MKHPGSQKGQSMKILGLFCLAVGTLICVSLFIKFATIIAKSTFDGVHRFTILQEGTPNRIYSYAPDTKTIAVLEVKKNGGVSVEKLLSIPVDATVENTSNASSQTSPDAYLQYLFFHPEIRSTLTTLDIFRLWLFARSVEANEIISETIVISERSQIGEYDRLLTELFSDYTLGQENKSIQVVNGTGISGVGNDFSRTLGTMGAHVVSVTTAQNEAKNTTIHYFGEKSYTLSKVEKILQKQAKPQQKKGISDIIILLGKDWDTKAL